MLPYGAEREWNRLEMYRVFDDLNLKAQGDAWLRGEDLLDNAQAVFEYRALDHTTYRFKPARDIRAEKTREYRKRRPRPQRIRAEYAINAGILFCLMAGR